jgi:hypothetical protein
MFDIPLDIDDVIYNGKACRCFMFRPGNKTTVHETVREIYAALGRRNVHPTAVEGIVLIPARFSYDDDAAPMACSTVHLYVNRLSLKDLR